MNLEDLENMEKAATPGPWAAETDDGIATVWYSEINSGVSVCDPNSQDARFIAAFRNAMPHLIAMAKAAERVLHRMAPIEKTAIGEATTDNLLDLKQAFAALEAMK